MISSTIQPATKDETSKSRTRNRRGCKNGVVAKAADVPTIKPSTIGHVVDRGSLGRGFGRVDLLERLLSDG